MTLKKYVALIMSILCSLPLQCALAQEIELERNEKEGYYGVKSDIVLADEYRGSVEYVVVPTDGTLNSFHILFDAFNDFSKELRDKVKRNDDMLDLITIKFFFVDGEEFSFNEGMAYSDGDNLCFACNVDNMKSNRYPGIVTSYFIYKICNVLFKNIEVDGVNIKVDSSKTPFKEMYKKLCKEVDEKEGLMSYSWIEKQVKDSLEEIQSSTNSNNSSSYASISNNEPNYSPNFSSNGLYASHGSNYSLHHEDDEAMTIATIGYVRKQWVATEPGYLDEKYGVFYDEEGGNYINGLQMGMNYIKPFGWGFGLRSGLLYELYYDRLNDYDGEDIQYMEHSLYLPLHLELRLRILDNFDIFVYGGLGFDLGLYASYRFYDSYDNTLYETIDNVYSDDDMEQKRFNASYEYGGGLKIGNGVQLQVQTSHGLIDMAAKGASYKLFQNKPWMISLSMSF